MDFRAFLAKHEPKPYQNVVSTPPLTVERENIAGNPYAPQAGAVIASPQTAPAVPDVSIAQRLDPILTIAEQVTGLTRREIFLQLLKTGVRGGGVGSLLEGLMGQKPAPEAKFIRYVKIIAIWVPAFVFLMGLAIIGVVMFAKFMFMIMGGL